MVDRIIPFMCSDIDVEISKTYIPWFRLGCTRSVCLCRSHCVSSPLVSGDVRVLESECKLNVISRSLHIHVHKTNRNDDNPLTNACLLII